MFPPLFSGVELDRGIDPFSKAVSMAELGCDSGTITFASDPHLMDAALVLAPEVPLADAMAMLPVCGVGFQNALGALAPPELSVHLGWGGDILVNGAKCGALRVRAQTPDPDTVPNWLVVSISVSLSRPDPHLDPPSLTSTTLQDEGCGEMSGHDLLESWSKHTLVWINRWSDEGCRSLHAEWRSLAWQLREEVTVHWQDETLGGVFVGIDERFGMLLRTAEGTRLLPLPGLLETFRARQ